MEQKPILFSFLFQFLCSVISSAQSTTLVLTDSTTYLPVIGGEVYLFEDKTGHLGLDEILLRDSLFTLSPQPVPNYGVTKSAIWTRMDIRVSTSHEFLLGLGFPNIDTVTLYYPEDGQYKSKKNGWSFPNSLRDVKAADLIFTLLVEKQDTVLRYYLRSVGRIVILPISIGIPEAIRDIQHRNTQYYLFYLGLVAMLFFYNFGIYIISREKEYLYYSSWVFFATLFFMISKGYSTLMIPERFNGLLMHTNIVSSLGGISIVLFVVATLRLKEYLPKIVKWFNILLGLYVVIILYSLFHRFQAASNLSQLVLILTVVLGLIAGVSMNRKGHSFAQYYTYGFIVTLVSMSVFILIFQNVFTFDVYTSNSIVVGSGIEMILFSFGLGAKIKAINSEKQAAQETAIRALKETEQLINQQNILLETKVEARTYELKTEMKKSDDLLLNILPADIAEELKENGISEARNYGEVSVLFTDFVNFTGISEKLTPKELVSELHICFKAMDEIIERHGMEKIKTIGDAYLAVCGLPKPCPTHAQNTVKAAKEILRVVNARKKEGGMFEIRIGINSGPVVAGIVGIKKFAYDIWGDTVNTAARMEQASHPGKINISGSTYELIKDFYACSYRGKLEAKNKGQIDMYFID
ncbi:MAG: adenylate/guanylate cyclase domain-containing protein [Saprospiraceae bacterium]|nr:adenylate/guanylate cyclase domain-containing protein [Saprospiraceae bacterium]